MNNQPDNTILAPAESLDPDPDSGAGPERPLNYRQEKFCVHYARSGNAAEAARLAGYSPAWADNQGYRLARDPRVRDRVLRLRVNLAFRFSPSMAFARLEYLFEKASAAGRYRTAAFVLTLQARLAGLESWSPAPAASRAGAGRERGVYSPKGADVFSALHEREEPG